MKNKLKKIFAALFIAALLLLNALWFIPVMGNEEGGALVVSEEKSFGRDILPIAKASSGAALLEKADEVSSLSSFDTVIIDGREKIDLDEMLKGFEGNVILIDPHEDISLKEPISGKLLILAEAGGMVKNDKNAVRLYNELTGLAIEPNGRQIHTEKGNIYLSITPAPLIMTGSLSSDTLKEAGSFLSLDSSLWYMMPGARLLISFVLLVSLLVLAWLYASDNAAPLEFPEGIVDARVKSKYLFFLSRAGLIVVSCIVSLIFAVILGLFDSLDKGIALFLSYIIGCSFTTRAFLHFGMLGIKGKPMDIKVPFTLKTGGKSLGFVLLVLFAGISLGLGGFWPLEISASSLIALAVVFILLNFGLIAVMQDLALLQKAVESPSLAGGLLLFPYIPLFLIAAIYIPMGEFYMTMTVLKLILWTFITLLLAKNIRDRTGSLYFASLSGAFCLAFAVCSQNFI